MNVCFFQVEILDQNDCTPEINVHAPLSSPHGIHQSTVLTPLPRSRLGDILEDWSSSTMTTYLEHPLASAYEAGVPVVSVSYSPIQIQCFVDSERERGSIA